MHKSSSCTSSPQHNGQTSGVHGGQMVPVVHDAMTFESRQAVRMREMEKFINEEAKRRKKEWERDVERMRDEFLHLYPVGDQASTADFPTHYQLAQVGRPSRHSSGEHETETSRYSSKVSLVKHSRDDNDLVAKRRGSTDVLDNKNMKTLFLEYPGSGLRYKLRFDVSDFDANNVKVSADAERIIVRGQKETKCSKSGETIIKEYQRKIEKPREVDHTKLKSCLTTDGILIIEAPLPPKTLGLRRTTSNHPSPSKLAHVSSSGAVAAVGSSNTSIRSGSVPPSPTTCSSPFKQEKRGVPCFQDEDDGAGSIRRKMNLVLDIGLAFGAKEITILIIKDNRIRVKARHEERTPEKLSKNKYTKDFELTERIETYSLRAGLTADGRLIVRALVKGQGEGLNKVAAGELIAEDINCMVENKSCNVLDLSSFPPTTPQLIASSYNGSG